MRAIIIDDEEMAVEFLALLLKEFSEVQVVGTYINPYKALADIDKLNVEVVFLDIEMGDVFGLEFANELLNKNEDLEIVFTTAYSEYAVGAFELNAIDYLLKPITFERLETTVLRLSKSIKNKTKESRKADFDGDMVYVKSFGRFDVFKNGRPLAWRTQRVRELFGYLWVANKKPVNKMLILEDIFLDKDLDRAVTILHTTIYQLRKVLKSLGYKNPLIYSNNAYTLMIDIDSDYKDFMHLVSKTEYSDDDIMNIIDVYSGDFMDQDGFPWVMGRQKYIQGLFIEYLIRCSRNKAREGRYDLIMKRCLDKLSEADPFAEFTVEQQLRYYSETGSKKQLLDFYEQYKDEIKDELGIEPSSHIQKQYEGLMEK